MHQKPHTQIRINMDVKECTQGKLSRNITKFLSWYIGLQTTYGDSRQCWKPTYPSPKMFLCSMFSLQMLNYMRSLFFNNWGMLLLSTSNTNYISILLLLFLTFLQAQYSTSTIHKLSFLKKKKVFLLTYPLFQSRSKQPPNGFFFQKCAWEIFPVFLCRACNLWPFEISVASFSM